MSKDFMKMKPDERNAEAKKWESGVSFEKTRPLSKRSQALWEMAKRGRGRPRKPVDEQAKRVLISLDPDLFALVETFASLKGLDRSKLFALSVEAYMKASQAYEHAFAKSQRAPQKSKAAAGTAAR